MKKQILWLNALVLCFAAPVFSQDPTSMPSFAPEIKRVAVFKNGYAFTYREGTAQTVNGWAYTTSVPVGAFGTVWGYAASPNVRVTQLLASDSDRRDYQRIENLAEFLLANEGSRARFVLEEATEKLPEKAIVGTYEVISPNGNFLSKDKISNDPLAYRRLDQTQLSFVVRTEAGAHFLPLSKILSVEVLGSPKIEKPTLSKENRLAIKIGNSTSNDVRLGIAALERGVQWIPAYRIEVKGEPIQEAKIELEALLVNEMTDLKDSEVYFVVGVPHFLFQNNVSPLSLNQTFTGISGNLQNYGRTLSNAIMVQPGDESAIIDQQAAGPPRPTLAEEEQAETMTAEQLFLYKAEGITLKKGERASMRLFSLSVPCSEVFEWTIDDAARPINYAAYGGQPIRVPDLTDRFWYGLRLKNQTEMPWTTAPALSFREWKPMGQDLLTFTPAGGENVLRVTPATEVIGTHKVEEKSRVVEQKRINGLPVTFDLVTLEGTVRVDNFKKKPLTVSITRNLLGKVTNSTDNGEVKREGLNPRADNPNSTVAWSVTVPPGEKEIRYTYKVYIRK